MTHSPLRAFMNKRGWSAKDIEARLPGFVTASHIRMCVNGKRSLSPALSKLIFDLPPNARPVNGNK